MSSPLTSANQISQSVIAPASSHAQSINTLWWVMFSVATVVFVAVMIILFLSILRLKNKKPQHLSYNASRNLVLVAGVAIPFFTIAFLVGGSLLVGRSLTAAPPDDALRIKVTGWMWWWEIEYLDAAGNAMAVTANELHVPVGRPVHLLLESGDVIHSFWVPQLQGKTDMIPGRTNSSWFTVSKPGTFRGQCAEFCGLQHALMAFLVIAQPPEEFKAWLDHQKSDARPTVSDLDKRGKKVFFDNHCQDCHTIRGTAAAGTLGPDLTHIASRKTLAAVTRNNSRGHLAGWISDPQNMKPGAKMPRTTMTSSSLTALVVYLESLK